MRFFLKQSITKSPLGLITRLHGMMPLLRNKSKKNKDIKTIVNSIKFFSENFSLPVLFPEGTYVTKKSKNLILKSQEYAKKNNLPIFKCQLTPRTTGFILCIEAGELDYVLDFTVGFKDHSTVLGENDLPIFTDMFGYSSHKDEFHIHIKKYKIKKYEKPHDLLNRIWKEKEKLLEYHNIHNKFPGKKNYVSIPFSLKIGSIFVNMYSLLIIKKVYESYKYTFYTCGLFIISTMIILLIFLKAHT